MSTHLYPDESIGSVAMPSESEIRAQRAARLVAARKAAGLKSARAAALIHRWKESTYRAHESGTRNFGLEDAMKYARAYGTDGNVLWRGAASGNVDPQDGKIPLPNIGYSRDYAGPSKRRLSVVGRAAGSPDGELIMSSEALDTVDCPPTLEDVPDAYAVYVVGDSMEPRYVAGEVVYIHPHKPVRRGDYVVVQTRLAGSSERRGFIKRFVTQTPTHLVLRQLNPDREFEIIRSNVLTIHKIVMSGEA